MCAETLRATSPLRPSRFSHGKGGWPFPNKRLEIPLEQCAGVVSLRHCQTRFTTGESVQSWPVLESALRIAFASGKWCRVEGGDRPGHDRVGGENVIPSVGRKHCGDNPAVEKSVLQGILVILPVTFHQSYSRELRSARLRRDASRRRKRLEDWFRVRGRGRRHPRATSCCLQGVRESRNRDRF